MGPLRARRKLYANKADSRGECREGTWGVPSSVAYEVPRNEPDAIYIGLNNRDARWHDLYKLRISSGERQLIRENTDRLDGYQFDNAGKLRLATFQKTATTSC